MDISSQLKEFGFDDEQIKQALARNPKSISEAVDFITTPQQPSQQDDLLRMLLATSANVPTPTQTEEYKMILVVVCCT